MPNQIVSHGHEIFFGAPSAYTATPMKIATTILIALAMFACGGGSGPKVVEAPPLLRGEGLYTLRYNPAATLSDRMEL